MSTADQYPKVLVSDFDGTMTRYDFFDRAYRRAPAGSIPDYWSQYERGEITHFEGLQKIFSHLPFDEETLWEIAQTTEIDPTLAEWVQRLQQAGWRVVVVSAGCDWYIRRLFAQQGVDLEVHSNPGEASSQGLHMRLPIESPFFCPEVGINKKAVVESFLPGHEEVAFAGDGRPDFAPASVVADDRRFATGWLAAHLEEQGIPFRRFQRWREIAEMLLDS